MPALRCASECGSSSSRGKSMPLSVDTRSHLTLSVDCADGAKSNCAWMLRVSRTRKRDPRNELAQTKSATQLIPSAASRFARENPTGTTNGPGTRWGRLNASLAMAGGRRYKYCGGSTHWGWREAALAGELWCDDGGVSLGTRRDAAATTSIQAAADRPAGGMLLMRLGSSRVACAEMPLAGRA